MIYGILILHQAGENYFQTGSVLVQISYGSSANDVVAYVTVLLSSVLNLNSAAFLLSWANLSSKHLKFKMCDVGDEFLFIYTAPGRIKCCRLLDSFVEFSLELKFSCFLVELGKFVFEFGHFLEVGFDELASEVSNFPGEFTDFIIIDHNFHLHVIFG